MKHPNKKIEHVEKFMAQCRMKSCFRLWMPRHSGYKQALDEQSLIKALIGINNG